MKTKIISLIILLVVLILLILKSYVDFYGVEKTTEVIKTDITSLETIKEEENIKDLSIINELPISDEQAQKKDAYTFKIKNNFDYEIKYNIYLKEDKEMEELDNCKDKLISINNIKYSINEKIDNIINSSLNNFIIYTDTLKPREEKEFEIRTWIADTTIEDTSNKHVHLKITNDVIKNNVKLINHLKNKATSNKNYYIDTDQAKEMYKINKQYRYIGTVPNNYIYFNCKDNSLNSCQLWRIVSIEEVLLNTLKKEQLIKIVNTILEDKTTYENIDFNITNEKIEEIILKKDTLFKQTNFGLLTIEDYKNTYANKVDESCYKNIDKCKNKSYLNSEKNEWLTMDKNTYTYISQEGNVVTTNNNTENYYRPVIYLKKDLVLLGGNGSKEMPYFIN